jgi:hypothetical protein
MKKYISILLLTLVFNSLSFGQMIWGINGHPTETPYSNYLSANTTIQMNYLKQLNCKYYRCSFEGVNYPYIMSIVVPAANTSGITVLVDMYINIVPTNTDIVNYNNNYKIGNDWAIYAISHNYNVVWELGNEIENWGLISIKGDGSSPTDFQDVKPGALAAIDASLKGEYQGIKDAYIKTKKIAPPVLFGATWHHWGLLREIINYNGYLPCDIISWHWYDPNYKLFNGIITDKTSSCCGRTPVDCLSDFKKDIWITECGRSEQVNGVYYNGSVGAINPLTQNYAAQAIALQTEIDNLKSILLVKAIFVYELLDDYQWSESQAHFGLVDKLNGTPKAAFTTFQNETK